MQTLSTKPVREQIDQIAKVDWRLLWYAVLIWFLTILVGGIVILPWVYPALLVLVVIATFYFFRKITRVKGSKRIYRKSKDGFLVFGLWVSLFWFGAILALNLLQIIGPYYFNFFYYYSDFRNWFLYVLLLIVPVIYSLILENKGLSRKNKKKLAHG